jgi:hypothetical protein
MAQENFKAVYIGSDDFWGYDADTFNEETNFFGDAWIVDGDAVTPELISEDNLSRCQMYYEIGKTDSHLFTPTAITFDEGAGFLIVEGNQGRIGQPHVTTEKTRVYGIGEKGQRYKNLTEGKGNRAPARFMVNYIVTDNEEDKETIKTFMESLDEEGEVEVVASAEEFDAETLNRINPVAVEGAEDVYGAESVLADTEVFGPYVNDNVVGQDYAGFVIGQDAEHEGYDDRLDESLGMSGKESSMKQSLKDRRDESKGMKKASGKRAYSRVSTMDAEGVPSGEWGSMNPEEANSDYQWEWRNAEDIFHAVLHAEQGAIEVHTTKNNVFLADIDTGAIMHDGSDFAAEDATPLDAEDIGFLLTVAAEGEGAYSFEGEMAHDYSPETYHPGEDPLDFNPVHESYDGEEEHDYTPESYHPGEDPLDFNPVHESYDAEISMGGTPSSPMNGVIENYGTGIEVNPDGEGIVHYNAPELVEYDVRARQPLRKFVDTTGGPVPQEEIDAVLEESGGEPEDVVEAFQELPLIKDVSMSGWSASLAVVGIAALTGAWFSRRY